MALIRDIDQQPEKQQRLQQILAQCALFGCKVLAEGIETAAELAYLSAPGIDWFQDYYVARSQLE